MSCARCKGEKESKPAIYCEACLKIVRQGRGIGRGAAMIGRLLLFYLSTRPSMLRSRTSWMCSKMRAETVGAFL